MRRSHRSFFAVAATTVAALSLAACAGGPGAAPTPTTATRPATSPAVSPATGPSPAPARSPAASPAAAPAIGRAPGKKIGLALSTLNNPFFVSLRDGAQRAAGQAGAELVIVDAANDNAKQADQIANFITQRLDVILVNPTDSDAIVPSIQKANEAGIPVIALDRAANGGNLASYIASNNLEAGKLGAQLLLEAVPQDAKVAMLVGIPGASAARDRGQGFTDALADSTITTKVITLVSQQVANFARDQALNVMQNVLTANPDIAGVFCQNDEMALGAVQAIQARGLTGKVAVVGVDGIADAIAAIKAGEMYGTIAQQPELIGELGVANAVKILTGQTPEPRVDVPLKVVTRENA